MRRFHDAVYHGHVARMLQECCVVDERADYAEVGIPEYWIVNPLDETITVVGLQDRQYVEHGVAPSG